MRVTSLSLADFRNFQSLEWTPSPGFNALVGENAQGKSSILEALYVLATTKSARAGRDSEMVRFDRPFSRIEAHVERVKEIDVVVELLFSPTDKKSARVNSVKQTRLANVIGQINAALFHSADLDIVRGEPALRRRFLDLEIAQTSPRYVTALAAFRRSLEQRNALLRAMRERQAGPGAREVLAAWDEQLAAHGSVLIERRISFIERLNILAAAMHHEMSDSRDLLEISYRPSFNLSDARHAADIKAIFLTELDKLAREEEARGKTLVGPQRDDLLLAVNAHDSRLYASQGQQRTIAMSLKLAERQLIEEMVGEPPLLLLDDVLSDLDDTRRAKLFDLIPATGSQTFLTCTNTRAIPAHLLDTGATWRVEGGAVR